MSRVLVISPHPDDEAIGCGGTLCRHVAQGDPVRVIFLTSGEGGGHGRSRLETQQLREDESAAAAEILRLDGFEFWHQPDGALRAARQVVDRLRKVLAEWKPDFVYVTHDGEMHPDHRAAARIVRNALSGPDAPAVKPAVFLFEVWTPMQRMDEIVDISDYLACKLAAIRAYRSQCEQVRFDEAALGLSRYRGELHSWPGGDYAEIFQRMRL
jgi:N-acetylglucosamine malate deacetylase 1